MIQCPSLNVIVPLTECYCVCHSVMYWSEGPTVSSMTTDTKVNQTLGTQFGNITCLSIHMNGLYQMNFKFLLNLL